MNEEDKKAFSKELTKLILEEDGRDSIFLNYSVSGTHLSQGEGFINEAEDDEGCATFTEETLSEIRNVKGYCTCTVLDLTFQVNHLFLDKTRKTQHDLYFKMFQSFRFK